MQSLQEQLHEELTCPICLDKLKQPKFLPSCGHTFCKDCLQTLVRNERLSCPVCRRDSAIFQNKVDLLANNYLAQNMLEILERARKPKKEEILVPNQSTVEALALQDFKACRKGDLSFKKGDVITILDDNGYLEIIELLLKNGAHINNLILILLKWMVDWRVKWYFLK